jgi:hypothetical protein
MVTSFSWPDQYLSLTFARLTHRKSLHDFEASLRAQSAKLYHLWIHGKFSRNAVANAYATSDWRINVSFADRLIGIECGFVCRGVLRVYLAATVHALDATSIDLCLSVFTRPRFRSAVATMKLHTLHGLRDIIPSVIPTSEGKMHEVNLLDLLLPVPEAHYVLDRAYLDSEQLDSLHEAGSFFVTRANRIRSKRVRNA